MELRRARTDGPSPAPETVVGSDGAGGADGAWPFTCHLLLLLFLFFDVKNPCFGCSESTLFAKDCPKF